MSKITTYGQAIINLRIQLYFSTYFEDHFTDFFRFSVRKCEPAIDEELQIVSQI